MTLRKPLRRCIKAAWYECIEEDFKNHRLNSERSLQAAFWFRLTQKLAEDGKRTRQIFIEPHILLPDDVIPDKRNIFPDLVICDSKQIIGIVELKYQPKKPPSFDKDLDTLQALWNCDGRDVGISNRRCLGPNSRIKKFHISSHLLIVWAGVHVAVSDDVKHRILPGDIESHQYFMRFHAETSESNVVLISSHPNGEP